MVLKAKIEKKQSEEKVKEFILKGSEIPTEKTKKMWVTAYIRMPIALVENVDELRKDRPGISRNAWILEAIKEKIEKD